MKSKFKILSHQNGIGSRLENLGQKDMVIIDIDMLLKKSTNNEHTPYLIEKNLPDTLNYLQDTNHLVILLSEKSHEEYQSIIDCLKQLNLSGIKLLQADKQLHHSKGSVVVNYLNQLDKDITRALVFDDDNVALDEIYDQLKNAPSFSHINVKLHHYQPTNQCLEAQGIGFPFSLDEITIYQSLGGGCDSTHLVKNDLEQPFVLKHGAHQDHIKVEILMNVLYQQLGVPTPNLQAYHDLKEDYVVQLSEYIDSKGKQDDGLANEIIQTQARNNFVIHAFLGNIDVAKKDNFIIDDNGVAKLIDAGSNFIFRAKGQDREEDSTFISELDSLRCLEKNKAAFKWFSSLSEAEIESQIEALLSKRDEIEKTAWEISQQLNIPSSLQNTIITALANRFDDLARRHPNHITQAYAKQDKAAIPGITSAGVLTLQQNDAGELCVLLSKRARHLWYDNFGGKSEPSDRTLLDTALREVKEESSGQIHYGSFELDKAPFHDIITNDDNKNQKLYRMYVAQTKDVINISEIKEKEHSHHCWVPLANLQQALDEANIIEVENQQTIAIYHKGESLPLFQPFYQMLKQAPMQAIIKGYLSGNLKNSQTQGHANHQDNKTSSLIKPILSPDKINAEFIKTQLNKAYLLSGLKQRFFNGSIDENKALNDNNKNIQLSQSEHHLRAVMADNYDDKQSLDNNIQRFVEQHYPNLTPYEHERLTRQTAQLIDIERQNPEKVYFYHAVNAEVSYAYLIYSTLYQYLNINHNAQTLRVDNPLFHQCLDINEFIAYFQSQSDYNYINNYSAGFMECAISANVFIFGNHQNDTSNTLKYYTDNKTRAPIDIKAMLEICLKEIGVSDALIKKAVALATQYPYQDAGVLYQMAIHKNDVDTYAYAAGYVGKLNPLSIDGADTIQLSQILSKMKSGQVETKYLKKLQARVIVRPNAPIEARQRYFAPEITNLSDSLEFNQTLKEIGHAMAFDVLNHHQPLKKLNTKTPLIRQTSNILHQKNDVTASKPSDDLIMRLINIGDFANLKSIIKQHPEYYDKKINTAKKSYIKGHKKNQIKMKTLFELLLEKSDSGPVVIELYGERLYYDKSLIDNIDTLTETLKIIPEKRLFDMVNLHKDKIKDVYDLTAVLNSVPLESHQQLASIHLDVIKGVFELSILIGRIPRQSRMYFATEYENIIKDISMLINLLPQLAIELRLTMAYIYKDKIKDGSQLSQVLQHLPETFRVRYASMNQDKIKDELELKAVLRQLPKHSRLYFSLANQDKIRIDGEFSESQRDYRLRHSLSFTTQ